jgi:hypothetical protein
MIAAPDLFAFADDVDPDVVAGLTLLFAMVAPRKRSGTFKFEWIEHRVANPRPLRPARRQAQGWSS